MSLLESVLNNRTLIIIAIKLIYNTFFRFLACLFSFEDLVYGHFKTLIIANSVEIYDIFIRKC